MFGAVCGWVQAEEGGLKGRDADQLKRNCRDGKRNIKTVRTKVWERIQPRCRLKGNRCRLP